MAEGVITRAGSQKKQRTEPTKLQRRARAYSFSPERRETLGLEGRRTSPDRSGRGNRTPRHEIETQTVPAWERTPTLHHNQSNRPPTRRKSSKRKKEDRNRAAEIKAMSAFVPVRPATDSWTAGRPMKKDSKRIKTTPGFGEHPTSAVSIPIADSIHESLTSDSEYGSFKVSVLSSLAPRPTLRYASGSKLTPTRASAPASSAAQKRPMSERVPIPEETLKDPKRIDDLVDKLDSSGLRELMEREDRRREKKKQRDQERAERRLARKAEQQKAEEAQARQLGTPPPENHERGVMGREMVGLGIDPASAVVTSTKQRKSGDSEPMPDADDIENAETEQPMRSPLDTFHRTDSIPVEEAPQSEESTQEIKTQESIASLPPSLRFVGLLRSRKSRSKSTLASEKERVMSPPPERIDEESGLRQGSVNSDNHGRFSLTTFLRWGGRSRRNSGGPSSFSNTSREEMHAAAVAAGTIQTPAQAQAEALARLQGDDIPTTADSSRLYLSRKPSASTRTKSRFREDLPDFPVSPPDSRVQSPEAEPQTSAPNEHADQGYTGSSSVPASRYDTPTSGHRQASAYSDRMSGALSPDPHHMSLASIDSEASWLSGSVINKRSSTMRGSIIRSSRLDQSVTVDSPTNSTQEDLSITEDDYLSRLSPNRNSGLYHGRPSGDGRPSSDEEDYAEESSAKWGAVGARPHFVQHRSTMQSVEGLLNIESGDEEDSEEYSPVTPSAQEKIEVQRARSVNLGHGHVRNFSGGSAKLLDITRRSSVDSKTKSERRTSAPLV